MRGLQGRVELGCLFGGRSAEVRDCFAHYIGCPSLRRRMQSLEGRFNLPSKGLPVARWIGMAPHAANGSGRIWGGCGALRRTSRITSASRGGAPATWCVRSRCRIASLARRVGFCVGMRRDAQARAARRLRLERSLHRMGNILDTEWYELVYHSMIPMPSQLCSMLWRNYMLYIAECVLAWQEVTIPSYHMVLDYILASSKTNQTLMPGRT